MVAQTITSRGIRVQPQQGVGEMTAVKQVRATFEESLPLPYQYLCANIFMLREVIVRFVSNFTYVCITLAGPQAESLLTNLQDYSKPFHSLQASLSLSPFGHSQQNVSPLFQEKGHYVHVSQLPDSKQTSCGSAPFISCLPIRLCSGLAYLLTLERPCSLILFCHQFRLSLLDLFLSLVWVWTMLKTK